MKRDVGVISCCCLLKLKDVLYVGWEDGSEKRGTCQHQAE